MAQEIRELDPTTVERIAAGEVVERPASVVKELVENSLDADASRVRIAVEAGGKESIRVSDDGIGMDEDALRRAVEKHTTSKIRDIDDLEGGLATLGFRGEALHAIGAVSRLTLTSRPRGGAPGESTGAPGTELTVEGGDIQAIRPAGCPEGTTVEVDDLFYNVPARRKYLSQDATEFSHVNSVVTAYALANPDVAVELEHDGRETFATTGQDNLQETVMDVYGREVAQAMIELDDESVPDGPLQSVSGLISHPETNRASREYLSTYVNGRYVTADAVREAVLDAYGPQLAGDRYPFAVLFVEIDPAQVDVNVHPRKMDVRFADADGVNEQIAAAVEDALVRKGLLRSTAPRGRSAPEQAAIEPGRDEDSGAGDAAPETGTPAGEAVDTDSATGFDDESAADTGSAVATDEESAADAGADSTNLTAAPDSRDTAGEPDTSNLNKADRLDPTSVSGGRHQSDTPVSGPVDEGGSGSGRSADGSSSVTATDQRRLGEDDPTVQKFDSLPSMRVLGQIHDTYVVAETDDGLVLIDQHAADERINYERLRERFLGETTTQVLAEPVEIELTARESALFEQFTAALSRLGFQAERVDDRTVEVRTVPALVAEGGGPELVRDVLSSFVEGQGGAETVEAVADELLADLACYPSVTANTSLTDGSIVSLLETLAECENPYACPHGRPVLIEIDTGEIEDRFERDYPGHV
ncbi:MAG: DNA mismatch repair endonuclease MutL [Halapricum sp.]